MKERHFLIAFAEKWSGSGLNNSCWSTVINAIDQHTAIQKFWQCKPGGASRRILAISELHEDCLNLPLEKPREC